jgi:hypothetical protein
MCLSLLWRISWGARENSCDRRLIGNDAPNQWLEEVESREKVVAGITRVSDFRAASVTGVARAEWWVALLHV